MIILDSKTGRDPPCTALSELPKKSFQCVETLISPEQLVFLAASALVLSPGLLNPTPIRQFQVIPQSNHLGVCKPAQVFARQLRSVHTNSPRPGMHRIPGYREPREASGPCPLEASPGRNTCGQSGKSRRSNQQTSTAQSKGGQGSHLMKFLFRHC